MWEAHKDLVSAIIGASRPQWLSWDAKKSYGVYHIEISEIKVNADEVQPPVSV